MGIDSTEAKTIRVLVVDDLETEFCVIRDLFHDFGDTSYQFDWEPSFDGALRLMSDNAYDVYLIDYGLGAHSALELIEKGQELGCTGPMIVITGSKDGLIEKEVGDAGADDFLVKTDMNYRYVDKSIRYALESKKADSLALDTQVRCSQALKMSALGELASGIAHEISNPLAIISTLVAVIAEKVNDGDFEKDEQIRSLKKIESMCLRISKMLKGVRSYSRDERLDPFEPFFLSGIIEESISLCKGKLNENGVSLFQGGVSKGLQVSCRPSELIQVTVNLINNAIDAVGGMEDPWIRLETEVDGDHFLLKVTDSGFGISQEIQNKILVPYFTTKPKGRGTGLGLSISKMLVESHSGTLFLSDLSENTQFVVRIPFNPVRKKFSILVVDDEPDIRSLVAEGLKSNECTVYTANTASEALNVLARTNVDTIITDINMPGISGMGLAEEIFQISKNLNKRPKVIFITGNRPLHIPKKIRDTLGACVFYKPFDIEKLKVESFNFSFQSEVPDPLLGIQL